MIALLRQRNYGFLWSSQLISQIGNWALLAALPFFVFQLTGSVLATGIMFIVEVIPSILLGSVAGVFVDRWNRRWTMIGANVARGLLLLLLLTFRSTEQVWVVYVVAFFESVANLFFSPANNALLPQLVTKDELVPANSLDALGENVARIIGPALGGALLAATGLAAVAMIDVGSYLIGAGLIYLIKEPKPAAEEGQIAEADRSIRMEWVTFWRDWIGGLRLVSQRRPLSYAFIAAGVALIGDSIMGVLLVVFVQDVVGVGAQEFGWILTARGVGGVLVFVPQIFILFLSIAILEDTGYMARAAFVMDHVMHKIGLHGKSFIPMLIGFGCSIPAIMATRILENRRNRFTTIMIIPLMSCGARLTIYALLIPAFFAEKWRGPVLWLIYLAGIVLAIICAKILRCTVLKGETIPFVMELPPYRIPTFKAILIHTWQRGWMYLKKAGTVILAISILLWVAMSFPKPSDEALSGITAERVAQVQLEHSVIGRIGNVLAPVIKPLGFDWKVGTALIGAVAAKEVFVSQLGIVYSVGEAEESSQSLREKLQANYTPLVGFCIMLFCLISAPCVATIAMTKKETNSWRWALFQYVSLTVLAYVITLIVYQVGSFIIG